MSRITKGTKVGDVVVLQGDPQQMRKIRCPGCQGVAVTEKDNTGRAINSCTTCGRKWRSVKM
jgi:hypothetical protein